MTEFKGSFVAIVTPFLKGEIDEDKFADLINWQIESGTNGIVACGTTGESPTLSHKEHETVIRFCVEVADGRVPVIAGTGSNSTDEAISLTKHAMNDGASAALLVNPYYNKPSQEGIYLHYKAVADNVDIPLIVYNIPGRTSSEVTVDTLIRLADHPSIVGVKDAVGDLNKTTELISRLGPEFIVLSGDDALTFPMMALGGHGVISTTANIIPERMASLAKAALEGDFETARKLHFDNIGLMNAMFYETNPVPVKTALAMMGRVTEEFRLPLTAMSQTNREKLQAAMQKSGALTHEAING
ncbi:4-hydroxy-tetrahydrodipicolinate synthase [hydrothermal vent metagenome]|uniref:4-hydroxy-tetrahydrodipicolinate synthase n=1 Tax=hydrothermal vent metagenome TaxID=652676 RepID=A0A3B1D5Q4_9ZZZZ